MAVPAVDPAVGRVTVAPPHEVVGNQSGPDQNGADHSEHAA
jgi:hypothetical protein